METLMKPQKLKPGDKVATLSLSWGGAGDPEILWRYQIAKERLETLFGLEIVEMPHTLSGSQFIYDHPEKRAEDLMKAFSDPSIKGIFSCIGGDESIRLLPYIDFDVIRKNPKVFMGYSDTTIAHLICLKARLSSFYGPSLLADFAENVTLFDYTIDAVKKALFESNPIGPILPPNHWTSEYLPWVIENKNTPRKVEINTGYDCILGNGIVQGRLVGGCIEVLEFAKGTSLWPELSHFENAILFFETSEETPDPSFYVWWLRNYARMGVLGVIKGMIIAKPYGEKHQEAYHDALLKVIRDEEKYDFPILTNLCFGHTEPMTVIPYGALAEINCEAKSFTILESGVIE